jgi:hypothetical protein
MGAVGGMGAVVSVGGVEVVVPARAVGGVGTVGTSTPARGDRA